MKVLLRLVCFTAVLISSLEADICEERTEQLILVSSAYEIDVRSCFLNPNEEKGPIIWYKNDSKTPISMDVSARIHQHKGELWFVPAMVEDSGYYFCTVRNASYCLKIKTTIKFVQHEPNLCYNTEAVFTQKLPVAADGQLVCPYMDFFKDETNKLPKIQWQKDCKPLLLDNIYFSGVKDRLVIANVTAAHNGKYTCGTFYMYLGKQYRVTRVIELKTIEEYKPLRPVIVSPANETVEVGLGSKLQLICNVSGKFSDSVFWKWNGSSIDDDDSVLAEEYVLVKNPSERGKDIVIAILNISEVESRFYLYPFTCIAKNTDGINSAYIRLIHPVPDFRKHTIGVFVMLTVIITCSVFIYKIFKVDIVLWYRDSCYDFLPQKASDGKTYDAYILYPKTLGEGSTCPSDIFVFKVLPEVLEEQYGYKLFIYGRDAYVGEDIVDVTNENIRKSRRLIIILVPEASGLGCLGNSSEEQIAMYNAFVQDGIKVVLLELEKIQDYEKMPETIKFIKRKHGAIRWSGDFREGSWSAKTRFWKNVRYHMPVQRQPHSSKPQFLSWATRPDTKKTLQKEVQVPLG
ncbi:interleukin-1 receptor type 1 isoform X1 [Meles meles]|uniref:interleukin-1 receptor type 1 isoform X1 n=1 Tax=Meles meles TaxID=9662 RepID=UPI001E69CC5A|nr:interleukin-1 receptor type 1 isoform X1 [Meles meles]XP_045836772.1 interleukin-1 receptor type 1 isoform X1 [Meles meles]XP_045836774.1 interleukin-1 receptor type 1 isoform X1 [Meles meles]XP_045836775.1 interleukin-1 receptor type 1 isoform X1 [Meles meles]XP_045836776.1 interleukin-1 receptor type 1 isoform X1 [Meles meles]